MQNVLHRLLLAVDDVTLEGGIEVAGVAQYLEEAANALLGLVLGLSLDVDREVLIVEVAEHSVQELKVLEGRLVVELDEREVAHEGWPVQTVDNMLDLGGAERRSLAKELRGRSRGCEDTSVLACLSKVVEHIYAKSLLKYNLNFEFVPFA